MKWIAAWLVTLLIVALGLACGDNEEPAVATPTPLITVAVTPHATPNGEATPTPEATPSPEATPRPTSFSSGHIAFVSDRDGNDEIYVMNADGTGLVNVSNHPEHDGAPAWSPDGTKIAFVSRRDGGVDIYRVNVDGTGLSRLTETKHDSDPDWSPDGEKIAFTSRRDDTSEIYVMNADGSNQTRVAGDRGERVDLPDWSPDGSQIAFACGYLPDEICVVNADGTGLVSLSDGLHRDFWPTWSPAGSRLAFVSQRGESQGIWTMNPDGTGLMRVTDEAMQGEDAYAWSPDGSKFAFDEGGAGVPRSDIYVVNADGTGLKHLTPETTADTYPTWSPDSKKIAFSSWRDGNPDIYVINADGTGETRLTSDPAQDNYPLWSP